MPSSVTAERRLAKVEASLARATAARAALIEQDGGALIAGIGTPFVELDGLRESYQEAQRALRHAGRHRPIVNSPDDISLFDDLTVAADASARALIHVPTRDALMDSALRSTLQAYIDADLNVAATASALVMHPNSVRYRLRRIGQMTGRDPRKLSDLLELATAARVIDLDLRRQHPHEMFDVD